MSGQPSYLELFPSGEIPHTFFTYQWWEDEATTVFWAFDPHEIKRVIRFGLFRDNNLPRKSLQKRDPQAITAFLYSLVEPHEMAFIDNLSHYQKVEEIIRRCQISGPPLEPWSWLPTKRDSDLPSIAIAEAIDTESHLHFTRISFEELVRYFLGYRAPSVEWFLQQHTALYIHLLNYLQMFPEELGKYKEVEQVRNWHASIMHRCKRADAGAASSDSQPFCPPCHKPVPTRHETASTSQSAVPGLPVHSSAYPAAIQRAFTESEGHSA